VHIVLSVKREVIVHDMGDAIDINATRSDVCGDEHADLA
jgi:hypothetical protein